MPLHAISEEIRNDDDDEDSHKRESREQGDWKHWENKKQQQHRKKWGRSERFPNIEKSGEEAKDSPLHGAEHFELDFYYKRTHKAD